MKNSISYLTSFSSKQLTDAGMALVLILLIIRYFLPIDLFFIIAMIALVINMIWPKFFFPFALIWYPLARALGFVMSKLLLSVVFFVLIVPVGLLRKLFAGDKLSIRQFKKNTTGVLHRRDHTITESDIVHPY